MAAPELPTMTFASPAKWERWLAENHASSSGIWMRIAKKTADVASVSHPEALEIALCFGWIDARKKSDGEAWWLQQFMPRAARSKWSKINCAKCEQLVANGRMKPAGLREMERAKADGRWDAAYEAQSTARVPDDLQHALDAMPKARAFFATLDSRNRYAILYRVHDAKKPETRAQRIAKFVAMLERHEKIYP